MAAVEDRERERERERIAVPHQTKKAENQFHLRESSSFTDEPLLNGLGEQGTKSITEMRIEQPKVHAIGKAQAARGVSREIGRGPLTL